MSLPESTASESTFDAALDKLIAKRIAPVLQALNDLRDQLTGAPQKWLSVRQTQVRAGCGREKVMRAIASGSLLAAEESGARGPTPKLRIQVSAVDAWVRRGCPT